MGLQAVSTLVGSVYTLVWSIGFWPPVVTNWRLKSIQGLSIDFLYFNFVGYIFYTTYFTMMLFSPYIRREFSDRYTVPGDAEPRMPLVRMNDFVFAAHGLALNTLTLTQAYWPWQFKKNDNQVLSTFAKTAFCAMGVAIAALSGYILTTHDQAQFQWLDLLTSLGLFKIAMSVCKNYVQLIYNYRRKSTHGWPILMIHLDFWGGFLSLCQLALDAYIGHDIHAMTKNLPKLMLSVEAVAADILFFLQHYYWYYESDVAKYGQFHGLKEDEQFLHEHEHDHDHLAENAEAGYGAVETGSSSAAAHQQICSVKSTDEGEMQRLVI